VALRDLLGRLLSPAPLVIDYSSRSDDEILALRNVSGTLTPAAQAALATELARRKLDEVVEAPKPRRPEPDAPIRGDPISVVNPAMVMLRTRGDRGVLCLFPFGKDKVPQCDPRTLGAEIEAVFLFDRDGAADIPIAAIKKQLQLASVEVVSLRGRSEAFTAGALSLRPADGAANAVIATWGNELRALIGAQLPSELLSKERITHIIGSLVPPAAGEPSPFAIEMFAALKSVVVLLDIVGASVGPAELFSAMGFQTFLVGEPPLKALADMNAAELEDRVDSLVIARDFEGAQQLLESALADPRFGSLGLVPFQLGVLALMQGNRDEALAHYARAIAAATPEPRGYANIGAIHLARGDVRAAMEVAGRAKALMPNDAISTLNLAIATARDGRRDEALAILDAAGEIIDPQSRVVWRERIEKGQLRGSTREVFPHLARKAYAKATQAGPTDRALELFRRALELQPSLIEARLDMGVTLSQLGRTDEALAIYDQLLAEMPRFAPARLNRANVLLRAGNADAAKEELERCLIDVPEWPLPRVSLASMLISRGERERATQLIGELKAMGADAAMIRALEDQLRGRSNQ